MTIVQRIDMHICPAVCPLKPVQVNGAKRAKAGAASEGRVPERREMTESMNAARKEHVNK